MILAGDIGGTKCNLLSSGKQAASPFCRCFSAATPPGTFSRFEDVIAHFRRQAAERASKLPAKRSPLQGLV